MQPVGPPARRLVKCPSCGTDVEWIPENRHRPFCSARCKGNDLGAWASDRYRVVAGDGPDADVIAEGDT